MIAEIIVTLFALSLGLRLARTESKKVITSKPEQSDETEAHLFEQHPLHFWAHHEYKILSPEVVAKAIEDGTLHVN